jgi:hypothetical protein
VKPGYWISVPGGARYIESDDVTIEEYAEYYHGARLAGLKPYTFEEYVAAVKERRK